MRSTTAESAAAVATTPESPIRITAPIFIALSRKYIHFSPFRHLRHNKHGLTTLLRPLRPTFSRIRQRRRPTQHGSPLVPSKRRHNPHRLRRTCTTSQTPENRTLEPQHLLPRALALFATPRRPPPQQRGCRKRYFLGRLFLRARFAIA